MFFQPAEGRTLHLFVQATQLRLEKFFPSVHVRDALISSIKCIWFAYCGGMFTMKSLEAVLICQEASVLNK